METVSIHGLPPVTLDESYARCRALARRHGTTYYWATMALPGLQRPHVWALYAFCRCADDIVDEAGPATVAVRAEALAAFGRQFFADLAIGGSGHPVLKAVVHTVRAFGIDPDCFRRFLHSMEMDLSVATYESWEDLLVYMDGSAAVIGEMMLPILEPRCDAVARPRARDLGLAFQLTNFLRDVGEDLDRGRVYVPRDDLARFGADPHTRTVDAAWRDLMRFEIERCRQLYASADLGIAELPPASAACVRAARILYSRLLEVIERADFDVFTTRARVSTWRKAQQVARVAMSSRRATGRRRA